MENNLKPFDLEAAKNGAKVVTRCGNSVRIVCFDMRDNDCPIVGVVSRENGTEFSATFTREGKFAGLDIESRCDLFMAPVKHEGWTVIYPGPVLEPFVYERKEYAEKHCKESRGSVVVKVEWEE